MKRAITIFIAVTAFLLTVTAQQKPMAMIGSIALRPYLSESYGQQVDRVLTDKLQQAAAQQGMAGSGFDDRFIITARLIATDEQQTATIPSKTALRLNIGIYIGDGIDGTLYSSWQTELRGIGDDGDMARLAALRKLNTIDSGLQQAVELGRQRIISYYDSHASSIIAAAQAHAAGKQYDKAILVLLRIPSGCHAYGQAQALIAQYGIPALEKANSELLIKATAAWSSSPNSTGAKNARHYMAEINYPDTETQHQVRLLCDEMSLALKQQADQQWQLLMQESKQKHELEMERTRNNHEEQMETIISRAQVEAEQAKRPLSNLLSNWWKSMTR